MNRRLPKSLPHLALALLVTYVLISIARWLHPATFSYESGIVILALALALLVTHYLLSCPRRGSLQTRE